MKRVFALPELLEKILLQLPIRDLLVVERTSKQIRATILDSVLIQRKLFHTLRLEDPKLPILTYNDLLNHMHPLLDDISSKSEPMTVGPEFHTMIYWSKCPTSSLSRKRYYRIWGVKINLLSPESPSGHPHIEVEIVSFDELRRVRWWKPSWPKRELKSEGAHRAMLLFDIPTHITFRLRVFRSDQLYDFNGNWDERGIRFRKLLDVVEELATKVDDGHALEVWHQANAS